MAARSNVNPALMGVLIALVIGTVVFTSLVIYKSNQIRAAEEGTAEKGVYRERMAKIEGEIRELRGSIAGTESALAGRRRERERLDLELLKSGAAFEGENLSHGALGEDVQAGDVQIKSKEHEYRTARRDVSRVLERTKRVREEAEGPERQTFPALETAISKRQTEQQQVMQRAQEQEQQFNTDSEALGQKQEELNTSRDQSQRQRRDEFSRQATKIGQLEDRIRDLLELELRWISELDPDGEVLETGVDQGFVVLDVGTANKVFPGLIFADFQYEKGHYHEKGMLEVIEVESHIATCRVVSEYDPRHYPIAKGDKVGNPVFDEKSPKVFVLAGEFENYNKPDLEEFIRKTGGVVRDKLSPGVDFLVAGSRSDKQQDNAREYQVLAMKEEQLLRFLQTTFAVQRNAMGAVVMPGAKAAPPPKQ